MITGFFRLKDRTVAARLVPRRGTRCAFAAPAAREIAYILREYAKLYLEMQDLWLRTRIRREDYAFLGDLRSSPRARCRTSRSTGLAFTSPSPIGRRAWREAHPAWRMPDRMAERLDAVRQAVGTRAGVIGDALGHRTAAVGASLSAPSRRSWPTSGSRRLPPFRQHGWVGARRRPAQPVLDAPPRGPPPGSASTGTRTWSAALRLRFWRINPIEVSWQPGARHPPRR